MTVDICATAREVHALLNSALPHAGDSNLEKAAALASITTDSNLQPGDNVRKSTFLAIQKATKLIDEGADAAKGQELLVDAIRIAEQWVRFACEEAGER